MQLLCVNLFREKKFDEREDKFLLVGLESCLVSSLEQMLNYQIYKQVTKPRHTNVNKVSKRLQSYAELFWKFNIRTIDKKKIFKWRSSLWSQSILLLNCPHSLKKYFFTTLSLLFGSLKIKMHKKEVKMPRNLIKTY